MPDDVLLLPKLWQLFCLRTRLWLLGNSFRAFSLPRQRNGGHLGTQHAAKLQLFMFVPNVLHVSARFLNAINTDFELKINNFSATAHNKLRRQSKVPQYCTTLELKKAHELAWRWRHSPLKNLFFEEDGGQIGVPRVYPVRDGPLAKWWGRGGEGNFQLARIFFSLTACAGIFFSGETLCTNFFSDKYCFLIWS